MKIEQEIIASWRVVNFFFVDPEKGSNILIVLSFDDVIIRVSEEFQLREVIIAE